MKNLSSFLASTSLALMVLSGCSSAKVRTLPNDDGTVTVIATDMEKDGAEEAAYKSANKYCEKQDKHAVFYKEASDYQGKMDENTRNTIRKAGRVGYMLGAPVAGQIGYGMTNDRDYRAELRFRCK